MFTAEFGSLGACQQGLWNDSLPGCEGKLGRHWCREDGGCGAEEVTEKQVQKGQWERK